MPRRKSLLKTLIALALDHPEGYPPQLFEGFVRFGAQLLVHDKQLDSRIF